MLIIGGVDPGKNGALTLLNQDGEIVDSISFKKHTYVGAKFHTSGHISNVYVSYLFNPVENTDLGAVKTLNEIDIEQKVFKTEDAILRYLLRHVENLGQPYRLDIVLTNKVKESRERNPELWI